MRLVADGLPVARPQVVDAGLTGQRLQVVAVHDLRPVVQVDVGDGRQRLAVSRRADLDPATVRREGAALDRARFDRVVGEARRVQGW